MERKENQYNRWISHLHMPHVIPNPCISTTLSSLMTCSLTLTHPC